MKDSGSSRTGGRDSHSKSMKDARSLSHRILRYSSQATQRVEFLQQVAGMLMEASGADVIELCVRESEDSPYWHARLGRKSSFLVEIVGADQRAPTVRSPESGRGSKAEELCNDVMNGRVELTEVIFTKNGMLWGHTSNRPIRPSAASQGPDDPGECSVAEGHKSVVLTPLEAAGTKMGALGFMSENPDYFTEEEIEFCADLAQTLGVAFANHSAHAALRERVKELTCLYGIARLVEKPDASRQEVLKGIVELLPPAWQYPRITVARIILEGKSYSTRGFTDTGQKQTADIMVNGDRRGVVEVVYLEERPRRDEGPFLKEERHLNDAIAREVALIVEREEVEKEKHILQEQLWHSDRLATVGELAAGVAHELNEPLGSILGFAQLTLKREDLPGVAAEDIHKIVSASLHARDVIRKLLVFARQKSPSKTDVSLNQVVDDALYFMADRCTAAGIDVTRDLDKDLPMITADPVQLHQALINLIINAIHAMPNGGTLGIETKAAKRRVTLVVKDSGIGMSDELVSKIFLPFFTTKDVDQGTGLGLSVVHGIVSAHGGAITVDSEEGRGSAFEIVLPVTGPPDREAQR